MYNNNNMYVISAMPWFTYSMQKNLLDFWFFTLKLESESFYILISHYGQMNSKEHNMLKSKEFQGGKGV